MLFSPWSYPHVSTGHVHRRLLACCGRNLVVPTKLSKARGFVPRFSPNPPRRVWRNRARSVIAASRRQGVGSGMAHPLQAAWAKRDAAHEHLETLKLEVQTFLDSNPYATRVEFDDRQGRFSLICDVLTEPPVKFSTRVGDVVHNLASALDCTAHELAKLRAGREIEMTSFPMFGDVRDYRRFRRSRDCWMRHLTIRDRAYFQRLQPYRARDEPCMHPLANLYLLWNQDKHKTIHTTLSTVTELGLRMTGVRGIAWLSSIEYQLGPLETGAEIVGVAVGTDDPSPEMKMDPEIQVQVTFENGVPVLATLEWIGSHVEHWIGQFATQFA